MNIRSLISILVMALGLFQPIYGTIDAGRVLILEHADGTMQYVFLLSDTHGTNIRKQLLEGFTNNTDFASYVDILFAQSQQFRGVLSLFESHEVELIIEGSKGIAYNYNQDARLKEIASSFFAKLKEESVKNEKHKPLPLSHTDEMMYRMEGIGYESGIKVNNVEFRLSNILFINDNSPEGLLLKKTRNEVKEYLESKNYMADTTLCVKAMIIYGLLNGSDGTDPLECTLLDCRALEAIRNSNKKFVIVAMGGAHIKHVNAQLKVFGYKEKHWECPRVTEDLKRAVLREQIQNAQNRMWFIGKCILGLKLMVGKTGNEWDEFLRIKQERDLAASPLYALDILTFFKRSLGYLALPTRAAACATQHMSALIMQ